MVFTCGQMYMKALCLVILCVQESNLFYLKNKLFSRSQVASLREEEPMVRNVWFKKKKRNVWFLLHGWAAPTEVQMQPDHYKALGLSPGH